MVRARARLRLAVFLSSDSRTMCSRAMPLPIPMPALSAWSICTDMGFKFVTWRLGLVHRWQGLDLFLGLKVQIQGWMKDCRVPGLEAVVKA